MHGTHLLQDGYTIWIQNSKKKKTKQKNNKKREIMIPGEILVDLTVLNGLSVVFLSESLLWKYYILLEK